LFSLRRFLFFFSSRRRHTRLQGDWSSDVCSSDLQALRYVLFAQAGKLAAEGGDAGLAFTIIDETGKTFAVDTLSAKAAALAAAVEATTTKEAGKTLLDLTLPLIDAALVADHYEAAHRFVCVAEAAARMVKCTSLVLDA